MTNAEPTSRREDSTAEVGVEDDAGIVEKIRAGSRRQRLELFVAFLMALAVIGAAWAGYQSSRWSTVQNAQFNASNVARVEANTLSNRGGQEVQVDVGLFFQAVNAFAAGDMELFDFYAERARSDFKPALDAWLASKPATNPDAALTPFALPEYQIEEIERSKELTEEATAAIARAASANQRSDNYVLATVVYAAVLAIAGVSSLFRWESVRIGLVAVATIAFAAITVWVATMPVTFTLT